MSIETERRSAPWEDLFQLAGVLMTASPRVGEVVREEDERRLHQRFDELIEETVGPMSREDFLRLAVVFRLRYGLNIL